MRAHLGDPVTMPEVARSVSVSVRALQLAFRRVGQRTPLLHLRQLRMAAAREALLRSGPDRPATVAVVARRLAYGNLGRFSAHYRETYGESPRDTLGSA